ncbi:hypothetical protein Tco_0631584 [Tanacetum coccineum]
MVKSWLVQDQIVLVLAIPGQTTTGKESSNPFVADLMDLCTKLIDKVTILENALKQSKESHAQTLTMLMKGGWKKLKIHEWSMTNFKDQHVSRKEVSTEEGNLGEDEQLED